MCVQASGQARTILRQMEDGKLLNGLDYSTSALVSLRQTCGDSGAAVKAQTPSGADAIFRAGVEAAVSAAMDSGSSLGGATPQRFISGLAQDLGGHTSFCDAPVNIYRMVDSRKFLDAHVRFAGAGRAQYGLHGLWPCIFGSQTNLQSWHIT